MGQQTSEKGKTRHIRFMLDFSGWKTASVTLLDAIAFLLLDRLTPHSYQWWKWGGVDRVGSLFTLVISPTGLLFPNLFACNWCDLGVSVATLRGFTYKLRVRGEQNTNDDVQPARVRCSFTGSGGSAWQPHNHLTCLGVLSDTCVPHGKVRCVPAYYTLLLLAASTPFGQPVLRGQNRWQQIKYLDVGPQAQLPPPYAEHIKALLALVLS